MKTNHACIYTRRSQLEEIRGHWSLEIQEQRSREYANQHGLEVVAVYTDVESGRKDARRAFQQMILAAANGEFSTIIATHTSRFFRNALMARIYKYWLREKLGIQIVFLDQPFLNLNDPVSKLSEALFELFDEFFLVQMGFWRKVAARERVKLGYHYNNRLPFGYVKDKETKQAMFDPNTMEAARMVFEDFSTGNFTPGQLAELLNAKGYYLSNGSRFTKTTIRDILQNRFYIGEVYLSGQYHDGNHPALINRAIFDKCQEIFTMRATPFIGSKNPGQVLAGVVKCSECGFTLNSQTRRGGYYVHRSSKSFSRSTCSHPHQSIRANKLDTQWATMLSALSLPEEWKSEISRFIPQVTDRKTALTEYARLQNQIRRLKRKYQEMLIDESDFFPKLTQLQEQLLNLVIPPEVKVDKFLSFSAIWSCSELTEKQQLTRLLVQKIYVDVEKEQIVALKAQPPLWRLLKQSNIDLGVQVYSPFDENL